MKKNNLHTLLLVAAIISMVAAFSCMYFRQPTEIIKTDTVFSTSIDTIIDTFEVEKVKPVPKVKEVIKRDTITKDTVLETERKYYQERFYLGKDTADVGVVTSGINTEIDSIGIKLRTFRTNTTNTVEIIKYVTKKRSIIRIQPQATFGYDALNKQWGAVIGIGVGVDI